MLSGVSHWGYGVSGAGVGMVMDLGAGAGIRGSLGKEAEATDLLGSLRMGGWGILEEEALAG